MLTESRFLVGLSLLALQSVSWAAAQPSVPEPDVRAQIEELRAEQARIAERQAQIDAKLRALEAGLGAASGATAAPAESSAAVSSSADSWVSRLDLSGDARLRSQGDYSDEDAPGRTSAQVRLRFGGTYTVSERLSLGARLVTGDADDPNSTDVQLSNFDDNLEVSLDLAYAQLNLGDLKLYGGRTPQPFVHTDLVWDGDVIPQGMSAVFRKPLADSAFRASALFFIVDEQAVGADSTMIGAQAGYDFAGFSDWKYDLSAAYYDYRLGGSPGADAGDYRTNLLRPDGSYLSDFDLADLVIGATWTGMGERWPARIVGDYVKNLGAQTSADAGYSVDLGLGRANRPGDWRLKYGYSTAETDAVLAAFSHDNIGIATNYRLHSLTLDYVPTPGAMLSAIWYHYQPLHAVDAGANDVNDWVDRVRLAFLVSF